MVIVGAGYRTDYPVDHAERKHPDPQGEISGADLVAEIRAVLKASPFRGEGYRKAWARLRFAGVRTSKRRGLRLMRENGLLAPKRAGSARGPRSQDGTITIERFDHIWVTDLTATVTLRDGQVGVFVAVDHCSAECVGIHAAKRATRFEVLEPIRQGARERFGAFAADITCLHRLVQFEGWCIIKFCSLKMMLSGARGLHQANLRNWDTDISYDLQSAGLQLEEDQR